MPTRPRTLMVIAAIAVLALAMTPGMASATNPPGNNGSVKVDDRDFDSIPDNEPHQGCVFQVQFFGFDQGALSATATFEVLLSTGDIVAFQDTYVFIGGDGASGAGTTTGLDASETYDLNEALSPYVDAGNPNQGVHVRLTVHADGATNADTKYKTFWAQGCEGQPPN